jgi:hypothetical protein
MLVGFSFVDYQRSLTVGSYLGNNATLVVSKHVYVQHPPPHTHTQIHAALLCLSSEAQASVPSKPPELAVAPRKRLHLICTLPPKSQLRRAYLETSQVCCYNRALGTPRQPRTSS